MARLFLSHARIDQMTADERVALDGDRLEVPALKTSFRLRPAVHFTKVVTDGGDLHGLIGRVKTEEQLAAMGAELCENSVILGEVAYECEPGFVGEVEKTGLTAGWTGELQQIPT